MVTAALDRCKGLAVRQREVLVWPRAGQIPGAGVALGLKRLAPETAIEQAGNQLVAQLTIRFAPQQQPQLSQNRVNGPERLALRPERRLSPYRVRVVAIIGDQEREEGAGVSEDHVARPRPWRPGSQLRRLVDRCVPRQRGR